MIRYEVEKLEDGVFKFTHIEKREGIDGNDVEVIKGRHELTTEKLEAGLEANNENLAKLKEMASEEAITQKMNEYKEELQAEIEISERAITSIEEMIEATK